MHAIRTGCVRWGLAPLGLALVSCVIDEVEDYDVGHARFCEAATPWPSEYGDLEQGLRERVDTLRRQGRTCGEVRHNPVATPELVPELRCAARVQATWLAEHSGLSHDGFDDTSALSRAALAGYRGSLRYELLARDFSGPGATLEAWLESDEYCTALFDRTIVDIGIGHSRSADGGAAGWVVMLGEQRND